MADRSRSSDGMSEIVAKLFIPSLDNPNWKEKYNPSQEAIKEAQDALGEEYWDIGLQAAKKTVLLILLIGVVDYFVYLDPIVYGLSVNIWGAVFLFFPSLRGRYTIATLVDGENPAAEYEIQARQMVFSNIGFVLLALGFILQLLAVQLLNDGGAVTANIFGQVLPSWSTPILVLLACYVAFRL